MRSFRGCAALVRHNVGHGVRNQLVAALGKVIMCCCLGTGLCCQLCSVLAFGILL